MLKNTIALGFGTAALTLGMVVASPNSAKAVALWSWSFGSGLNSATGTFTTSDVSDPNNPIGECSVSQFTLTSLNGTARSFTASNLGFSPQFVYTSSTNYGFKNSFGFFDSGFQSWDPNTPGGDNPGDFQLSGSADYQAGLGSFQRGNSVRLFQVAQAREDSPGNLRVSLLEPPPSTPIPTPALLPGLIAWSAAVLRNKKNVSSQEAEVS